MSATTDIAVPRRPGVLMLVLREPAAAAAAGFALLVVLAAILAPWLAPTDPFDNDLSKAMQPPGSEGLPLGGDTQGRDMITRLLFGLRVTLLMGVAAVAAGGGVGAVLGFAAAFYKRLDGVIMRLMDVLLSFPAILFGLAIAAIFGPGLFSVVLALSIATVPLMPRAPRACPMRG
jgi:ABC-type dipeptide/oligopeptide/nickel transport system permease subunit